ncbi:Diaminopimelate decarboxylase [Gilliamella apicola SCGC AB-598-B02]|nr:Diaminopimelate decarboxylase [Gilliamella apicola SCGC AB-598-B02]
MDFLHYQNGQLFANQVAISDLAEQYGTPLYVYSSDYITKQFLAYQQALTDTNHLICYAVKANSNLSVLKQLAI